MPNPSGKKRIIAFSGVDGSGKTTQAKRLASALERLYGAGAVVYRHGNRPWIHQRQAGFAQRRSWLMSILIIKKDLLKIWLDLLRRPGPIVIFDRFVDDAVAKFMFYHPGHAWVISWVRFFSPRADCLFWLDVPAAVSYERDREHPFAYHERKHAAYNRAFQSYRNGRVIRVDASRTPDEVADDIWQSVEGRNKV